MRLRRVERKRRGSQLARRDESRFDTLTEMWGTPTVVGDVRVVPWPRRKTQPSVTSGKAKRTAENLSRLRSRAARRDASIPTVTTPTNRFRTMNALTPSEHSRVSTRVTAKSNQLLTRPRRKESNTPLPRIHLPGSRYKRLLPPA